MSIVIDCHGESHVGRSRPVNEDQFLIADLNKSMRVHQTSLGLSHQTRLFGGSQGKLLLVADGLGGHESGERASTLAVDGVANYVLNAMDWFIKVEDVNEEELIDQLKQSFWHSQAQLTLESDAIPQRRGMATTLTLGFVAWPNLYVVHVGDTRCYHIRGKEISRLTTDHTMAQLASDAEPQIKTDRDEDNSGASNPMANVLWNVVGGNDRGMEPQISKSALNVGDCLLLCSDGLTRYVNDDEILNAVSKSRPSQTICQELIEMAIERGGKDNITVVLAKFSQSESHMEDCEAQRVDVSQMEKIGSNGLTSQSPAVTLTR